MAPMLAEDSWHRLRGKTTLLSRLLLEGLRGSARNVVLFQTQCNSHELLHYRHIWESINQRKTTCNFTTN